MPLSVGDKLGPYEILAPIGAGGMGQVYRAHDSRLRRDVAIKVSAERFSERFEKEARAIASLNHTNVCTLHDVGPNYLVMELVEGHTLAERIKEGAVPLDEALVIAKQIAAALEAAHEKGITHRDLKPGNIIIKPDGTVKVLDFGLAKMGGIPTAQSDHSPTLTIGLAHSATQAGVILGTAAYMAPEQARGKEVDKRADIWAFGVVLYEMLTGQKLFKGDDLSEILASVIKEEPKFERAPAKVQRLLRSCLEKDPTQRLQAIGDWRLLLEDQAPPTIARVTRIPWITAAVLAIVAAVLGFGLFRATRPAELKPLVRLDVDLGADVSLLSLTSAATVPGSSVAISPDGMRLAYVSGTPLKLFTRRLDQSKAMELPGVVGAAPFFSADSQWIGFSNPGKLSKISVEGGAVVPLAADLGPHSNGSWSEDGSILEGAANGLLRIRDSGGSPETIAPLGNGEVGFFFPQLLPGGKAVLFSAYTALNADASSIEVMTLADHHRKTVSRGGTSPQYLSLLNGSGYLVYLNKATLFAIPFDLDKLETRGTALPILDDVASTSTGTAQLSISRTGTLVYRRTGGEAGLLTVAWLEGAGKTQPLLAKPGVYGRPILSPDGQRVAVDITDGSGTDIWAYDAQRDTMTRLTFTGRAENAVWTPDGRYIVFRSGEGMSVTRSDGAGKAQLLTQSKNFQFPWSITADGKRVAFEEGESRSNFDLWTVPIESDGAGLRAGKPEVFLQTPANEMDPMLSPDGRWLAYSSNESGTYQIYVRAFPDKGGKWQISNAGGGYPIWSRTGHDLFFETLDNRLMAAAYTVKGDSLLADKPRMWSDKRLGGQVNGLRNFDLAPDGKRIAALMPAIEAKESQEAQNHIVFLENFFDELRRKVPVGK